MPEPEQTDRRAVVLGIAACVVLLASWLAYRPAGPFIALAGGAIGWLLARATTPVVVKHVTVDAPQAAPAVAGPVLVEPDNVGAMITALRHDLRGILSPAMLIADRLQAHQDPTVQRAGAVVSKTVERAAARLAETKDDG